MTAAESVDVGGERSGRGRRGTTTIAPEVIAKIAVHAAEEIDAVHTVHRSALGRWLRRGAERVDVEVERSSAVVDLVISIRYPAPVATTAARVRQHVRDRITELAGLDAAEVHLEVDRLSTDPPPRRRVE